MYIPYTFIFTASCESINIKPGPTWVLPIVVLNLLFYFFFLHFFSEFCRQGSKPNFVFINVLSLIIMGLIGITIVAREWELQITIIEMFSSNNKVYVLFFYKLNIHNINKNFLVLLTKMSECQIEFLGIVSLKVLNKLFGNCKDVN